MRILWVEDDAMIAEAVAESLRDQCYRVDWIDNGKAAADALLTQHYDMILLDLGLPGLDGLSLLRQLRQRRNNTPVLILTARDDMQTRLQGLDSGADDFLVKPFDLSEMHARIRAITRRHHGSGQPKISNGVLSLDPQTHQLTIAGNPEPVVLSNKEFALLQALILCAGSILSRADLEDKLYGWGEEVESNAVDFLIFALRKKIGKDQIKNVRGVGWLVSKAP